jgi:hypothetical protein
MELDDSSGVFLRSDNLGGAVSFQTVVCSLVQRAVAASSGPTMLTIRTSMRW